MNHWHMLKVSLKDSKDPQSSADEEEEESKENDVPEDVEWPTSLLGVTSRVSEREGNAVDNEEATEDCNIDLIEEREK